MHNTLYDARTFANSTTANYYRLNTTGAQAVAPHLEGSNICYADGHAKWQNRSKLQSLAGGGGPCNLANPGNYSVYCDRDWNPFLN